MKRTAILLVLVNLFEALHIYLRSILTPTFDNTYLNIFNWGLISQFNNYSIDFYRRSIIGSLMQLVNMPPNLNNLILLKFILLSTFVVLFSFFFKKLSNKDFFLIALSPFLIQQFIFGSLYINDLLTYIFFISSLISIQTSRIKLLFILLPLGILNHLVFAVFFCPLIIYFVFKKSNISTTFSLTLIWLVTSIFLVIYGKFDIENIEQLKNNILLNGFEVDENQFNMIMNFNTFLDNVKYSTGYLYHATENVIRSFTFGVLVLIVIIFLIILKNPIKNILVPFLLATSSLFMMFILGFDYPRWLGFYISSILIVLYFENELKYSKKLTFLFLIIFCLGPIGTSDSFPLFFRLIDSVFLS